jgi:hypothetical protein
METVCSQFLQILVPLSDRLFVALSLAGTTISNLAVHARDYRHTHELVMMHRFENLHQASSSSETECLESDATILDLADFVGLSFPKQEFSQENLF